MTDSKSALANVPIDQSAILRHLGLNPQDPAAQALVLTCERYGLDPILRHMLLIENRPYITRDGLLHVAHASGQLDGIVVEEQSQDDSHHIAKVAVYRKDMSKPFAYVGRYPLNGQNKKYGPEMAVKCAEVMALRRAFDVSITAREEMWDAPEAREAEVKDSGGAAPAPNVEGAADEQTSGTPSASPPVSDWVDDAAETFGEGELIDAAEAVRQEMGVGSQITALSGVRLVAEGSDPHRRIIERLDKALVRNVESAAVPEEGTEELVRQLELAITSGMNGPNGKKITRGSVVKALTFATTHNGGVIPSDSGDPAAWPEASLRTVVKELNLEGVL